MRWFAFFEKFLTAYFFIILSKNGLATFLCFHIRKQMETEKLLKVAQNFICEKCDYTTSKLSSYKKHLTTAKHLGKQKETKKVS